MRHWFGFIAVALASVSFSQNYDAVVQMLSAIEPRELGPTTMGGRISDLAIYEKDQRIIYVGSASGGVWKTEDGGRVFSPVFDKQATLSIGAVAVDQNDPKDVWVGTGEGSSRNSTCIGEGLYHSTDGGATWTMVGLQNVRQFGRIAINPSDSKTLLVAAVGNLWGPNPERGLYKTTDEGKTWKKVIDGGDKVGAIDVRYDPKNPKNVLAVTWERLRVPHNFYSRSDSNGIYRSTDGGDHWTRVTKGLPEKEVGRIGIDVMRSNPKIWVATVDAKEGSGFYRSEDGGVSWTKMTSQNPRPFYFSVPRADPLDENRVYLPGTNLSYSDDKGKTFKDYQSDIHPDFHAAWIDPTDSNHMLFGNDGGVVQTRDRGKTWEFLSSLRVGQFYNVDYNMRIPYWVGGGAQDNGSWAGPTQARQGGVAYFNWLGFQFGDGFYVQFDKEDSQWFYSESQGGGIIRSNLVTGENTPIRPSVAKTGDPAGTKYRFNWSTPFLLSPFNQSTIYLGGNILFKSVDRGLHWKSISPDLTTNDPEKEKPVVGDNINSGAETHCTIITLNESPVKPGLLWVGTDDGLVQMSPDDGGSWKEVTGNFSGVPKNTWVSRVAPSAFKAERCYVSFDGHRSNDYKPYVYMTEDNGATWKSISSNLPEGPVYVVKEDPKNEDLLFVGTEFGLFISVDRGATWNKYTTGAWPNVRVDDVTVHPRDLDLIVGTHGRSFWTIPIAPLEQLTADNRGKDSFLCTPPPVYLLGRINGGGYTSFGEFVAPNTQPKATLYYWLKAESKEKVQILVQDILGNVVSRLDAKGGAGLNSVEYRPRGRNAPRKTGDYAVVLKIGDKEAAKVPLRIEDISGSVDGVGGLGEELKEHEDGEIDPKG